MTASIRLFSAVILIFTVLTFPGRSADPGMALDAHLEANPGGMAAFTFDRADYRGDIADLPIGVFDSGVGGLTVLEAILTLDAYHNDNLKPGADGRPDFENERFLYLGDQANMPYGNYPKAGKLDYLRELILKDAVFLLGKRYHSVGMVADKGAVFPDGIPHSVADSVRYDKPPVKAIVIACNTATAYGFEDLQAAVKRWNLPVIVVGVVEAGARGLLETTGDGAIGVMATVGTCDSGVYPRTIQSTLGRAGRGLASITQYGSADLAAVIEGDPSLTVTVPEQVATDVRRLVEAHRDSLAGAEPIPLAKIVLGCTHFPLVVAEIEAAFASLREDPALAPYIAAEQVYVDPAEWTARQLFRELASAKLRRLDWAAPETASDRFFLSIVHPTRSNVRLNPDGSLHHDYKYGRDSGQFFEDTIVVPMTRTILPETGRRLVSEKLPEVWSRLPE